MKVKKQLSQKNRIFTFEFQLMTIPTVYIPSISCSLKPQWWGRLLTWQWSRRQTFMPSIKRVSHRGSLLKGVAVYRVLYQSILNAKLTGRNNLGRKRCTSNRDDHKLENTVKQSWFKTCFSASRFTVLRRLQEKGYQTTSEPETTSEASYLGCREKIWTVAQWSKAFNLEIKHLHLSICI